MTRVREDATHEWWNNATTPAKPNIFRWLLRAVGRVGDDNQPTVVVMSKAQADALGIKYLTGEEARKVDEANDD